MSNTNVRGIEMTIDRNHPAAILVATLAALIGCSLVIYFAYGTATGWVEQTYPPPECAPTDCESVQDQYLTTMRMQYEDGEWHEDGEYATTSDEDLLWMGLNLCDRLGSLAASPLEQDTVELAMFSTNNDLDARLVVNAAHLCSATP